MMSFSPGFHIDEAAQSEVGQGQLVRVEDMEEVDFESPVDVGVEGREDVGGIVEEIGDDDEGAPAGEEGDGATEGFGESGDAAGLVVFQGHEEFVKMLAGRSGRKVGPD